MSDLAKVGAVVIIVLALVIGLSQLITGETLFRGKSYFVMVRFENGLGLRKGMPLKLAGTDVGWVEKITLTEPVAKPTEAPAAAAEQAAPTAAEPEAPVSADEPAVPAAAEPKPPAAANTPPEPATETAETPAADSVPAAPELIQYTQAKIRVLRTVQLHEDARFIISQEGLIGEKFLSVEAGSSQLPLVTEGQVIYGSTAEDITHLIANASQVVDSVQKMLGPDALGGALTTITASLNESLLSVNSLVTDAGGIIHGSQGYIDASLINVQAMSEHLLSLSKNLEDASVSVQTLAKDPRYADAIASVADDLTVVSGNLSHLSAQLDTLVSDPEMQDDARSSVKATREVLEEAKKTLQRFQLTLDKVDGVLDGANGLIGDTSGAIGEAKSKLESFSNLSSRVNVKMGLDVRAVDRNKNNGLDNADSYVGDINADVGFDKTYVSVGADNIGEDTNWNFLMGYGSLDGFSMRGGVYRGELGLGAKYNLAGGGGVDVMLYDTQDPKLNAYGRIPVGDSVNVVVGVEDVQNDPQASVGVGVDLGH